MLVGEKSIVYTAGTGGGKSYIGLAIDMRHVVDFSSYVFGIVLDDA